MQKPLSRSNELFLNNEKRQKSAWKIKYFQSWRQYNFEVRVQSFTHNSYLRISMGALKSAIFCEQTFAEKSSVSTRVVYSFVLQSHHKDSHHL